MAEKSYPYAIVITNPDVKRYYDDEAKALFTDCKLLPQTQELTDPDIWLYVKNELKEKLQSLADIKGDVNIVRINSTKLKPAQIKKLITAGVEYIFLWDEVIPKKIFELRGDLAEPHSALKLFTIYAKHFVEDDKSTDSSSKKRRTKIKSIMKVSEEIMAQIDEQVQVMNELFMEALIKAPLFAAKKPLPARTSKKRS